MERIDFTLYLVTDRKLAGGRPIPDVVRAAVRGGVTCVQLREKSGATRAFIRQAMEIKGFLQNRKVPLIINDRIDVAMAVGADGVHLGQSDMPLAMARDIAGQGMIIGISAESLQDAVAAEKGGADYLGISPVFRTPTKADTAPALGLKGLGAIREAVKIPMVGIGGLNRDNVAEVIRMGADGVAVVSAIMAAKDPEAASRDLRSRILLARTGQGA